MIHSISKDARPKPEVQKCQCSDKRDDAIDNSSAFRLLAHWHSELAAHGAKESIRRVTCCF